MVVLLQRGTVRLICWKVGRKGTFLLAAIACGVGVAVQAAGPPAAVFVAARLVHGIGLGLISIVVSRSFYQASITITLIVYRLRSTLSKPRRGQRGVG